MRFIKTIALLTFLLGVQVSVFSQHQLRTSQFYMNAPAVNPAFTGIDDFIDLKLGFRQNWSGFDESPQSYYLGVYGAIKKADPLSFQDNSLRISAPSSYDNTSEEVKKGLRHGVGLMIFNEQQFALDQMMITANYALHLNISRKLNFTVGTSFGLYTREIDVNKLTIKNRDDNIYQALLANGAKQTFFDINFGALLYSDNLYFGVAALPMVQSLINSNGAIEEKKSEITYNMTFGYQFPISTKWRLQPSMLVYYDPFDDINYEANVKIRSYDIFWAGLSYRSNESVSLLLGTTIKRKLTLSYSYDFFYSDVVSSGRGSHELVLGFALLKRPGSNSYSW